MSYTPLTPTMYSTEHGQDFCGKPLRYWHADQGFGNLKAHCPCIADESPTTTHDAARDIEAHIESLVNSVYAPDVDTLAIGLVQDNHQDVVDQLVEYHDSLPALKNLYLGCTQDNACWLNEIFLADISELLDVFPQLEVLVARGMCLELPTGIRHNALRHLCYQAGTDEDDDFFTQLGSCSFPHLQHLEVWSSNAAWSPLLANITFPQLGYLGMRNAANMDRLIRADFLRSAQFSTLHCLDLSGSDLSADGLQTVLTAASLRHLSNINASYCKIHGLDPSRLPTSPTINVNHQRPLEDRPTLII